MKKRSSAVIATATLLSFAMIILFAYFLSTQNTQSMLLDFKNIVYTYPKEATIVGLLSLVIICLIVLGAVCIVYNILTFRKTKGTLSETSNDNPRGSGDSNNPPSNGQHGSGTPKNPPSNGQHGPGTPKKPSNNGHPKQTRNIK